MLSVALANLVTDLRPREKDVISGRFGLDSDERKTLAEIGEQYSITRERVRQIEAEALTKLRDRAGREKSIESLARRLSDHLEANGGLRRRDLFLKEVSDDFDDNRLHEWHILLVAELFGAPQYEADEGDFHPVWFLKREHLAAARKFIVILERFIRDKKNELIDNGAFGKHLKALTQKQGMTEAVGLNYVLASRRFAENPFGDRGLAHWEEIAPKTMGSRAYIVMKKHGKPLHFRDIAQHINKVHFDDREALPQTIHNELIKDPRFVLVGRGMYGLREHGYAPGTTREVIREILKKQGPLSMLEVVEMVLKRRFLERNTILLNLQNRKHFKRLPDGRYSV